MSFYTSAVVAIPFPLKPVDELTGAILADGPRGYNLTPVVAYPMHLFVGEFNHVVDEDFMEWLSGLPWRWEGGWPMPRHRVRVFTHHENADDSPPSVWRLTDTSWERMDLP